MAAPSTAVLHESALIQRHRTLGELVTELRGRLGFVAQGPSANFNKANMVSFLQEAHAFVTAELGPVYSRKKTVIKLEPGSYLYDWNNDEEDEPIDPGTVISVWLNNTPEDRELMMQGISEAHRAQTERSRPFRYDTLNGQIEVFPVPDLPYDMLVEYIGGPPRFTMDDDRPGVDDRLILLYALSIGKAHFRQPDAQASLSAFNRMLSLAKGKQHQNHRYSVKRSSSGERTVEGRDGNYTFRG